MFNHKPRKKSRSKDSNLLSRPFRGEMIKMIKMS